MRKLLLLLICLMVAGSAWGQTDSIGGLDTTVAGSAVWANNSGYYRGSDWVASSTGTLDSISGIYQFSAAAGLKIAVYRSSDSTLVDSTIIDTVGPDTATFTLAFVGHDTIKTDTTYILVSHCGSAGYLCTWNWTDSAAAKENIISRSGRGQPGTTIWPDTLNTMTATTTGKPRLKAFITTGGEPPATPKTSKVRDGKPRSKWR